MLRPGSAMKYETEQENFWSGDFGDSYTERNQGALHEAALLHFFSEVLTHTGKLGSAIEFGANRGLNLITLRRLVPEIDLAAIEINESAVEYLETLSGLEVNAQSILDFEPKRTFDLALIRGVLIHVNPEKLPDVYDRLYKSSHKYILVAEYYNPSPVALPYRGHEERLFKRDFAGEILDQFPDLTLRAYGFCYRRDPVFPQDDISWFLLQKP
jgi:pseudaminic acid biosynthesis-associated methylase